MILSSIFYVALSIFYSSPSFSVNGLQFGLPPTLTNKVFDSSLATRGSGLYMTATEPPPAVETKQNLIQRDRYIASNRFAVRPGKEAKFEQRWATRKSRLASLEGFRYFHLMKRVGLEEKDSANNNNEEEELFGNYVSFTVWKEKKDFTAWRKGDAFKEAHGGTSIGAFLSTMLNSALVLKGPPRPAFYDGILTQSTAPDEESLPEIVDGWRKISDQFKGELPSECFVACNQFYVPEENREKFEQRWANRESKLKECDGFNSFFMLRRDGTQKGHGTVEMKDTEPTYMSCTIWDNREAFDGWRKGNAFKQAHGVKPPSQQDEKKEEEKPAQPPMPLWSKPPQPIFYEGKLVISSADGA